MQDAWENEETAVWGWERRKWVLRKLKEGTQGESGVTKTLTPAAAEVGRLSRGAIAMEKITYSLDRKFLCYIDRFIF